MLDKFIHDFQKSQNCLALNEMHMKLASTPPPEVKKTVLYSRVLNTRGGLNNWRGGNIFWKLISEGVGNSYKTSPFCVNQEDKCIIRSKIF